MRLSVDSEGCSQGAVRVHDPPDGASLLRVSVNGILCHSQPPSVELVDLSAALADVAHLVPADAEVLLSVVAVDAQREPLAEAQLGIVPPARRSSTSTHPAAAGGRLLAAALQRSGERHTWRLRPADTARTESSGHLGGYHVYLRLVAEVPGGCSSNVQLTVTWSTDEGTPPPRKRARGGAASLKEDATLGSTTCTARLLGGEPDQSRANDSVFLCFVRDVDDASVVQCQVTRSDREPQPGISVRYAVHAHAQPCAALPTPLVAPPTAAAAPSPPTHRTGRRRAVLVGVSKYSRRPRGDLEWCDEDVTAWYRYLTARGYDCLIFGDEFSPYPRWDGPATVGNVRTAVQAMVQQAGQPEDHVVFVDSSHGNGDGNGASYLCLLPEPAGANQDEREGKYWDKHLSADLSAHGTSRAATFVFLDACFSGGILQELVEQLPVSFGTSTCTQKGYGYDESMSAHGAWTETFLVEGLERQRDQHNDLDLVALFEDALHSYTRRHTARGDRPCCFLSIGGRKYNTNDAVGVPLPRGAMRLGDVL